MVKNTPTVVQILIQILRLNPDGTPKPGFEPINKVDEVCMHHDYNYQIADNGVGTRHEADKIMLDELDN